jgi:Flp pilus assembly protein TadG
VALRASYVRSDSGQSVVEVALVLPVLMLVVLGIVGFGTALGRYQTLEDATTAAARFEATCRTQAAGDAATVGQTQASGIPGGANFTFNLYGTSTGVQHNFACNLTSGTKVTVTGTAQAFTVNLGFSSITVPLSSSVTVTEA